MFPWIRKNKKHKDKSKTSIVPELGVILSKDKVLKADLINIHTEGALLSLHGDECIELVLNKDVGVKLKDLIIDAQIKKISPEGRRKLCYFQFINSVRIPKHLFQSCMNRRQGCRVEVDVPIMVTIVKEREHTKIRARMIDISSIGIGLEFDNKSSKNLRVYDRVNLSFRLPDFKIPFELIGTIVYKKLKGQNNKRFGIRFDWSKTKGDEPSKQEKLISYYVMRCQQQRISEECMRKKSK